MRTKYQPRQGTMPRRDPRPSAPRVELVIRVYGERDGRPGYMDWRQIR